MFSDFFINIVILIAVTFIGGNVIKEVPSRKANTLLFRFLSGILCGGLGILLLIYSVPVEEVGTLVDLRLYAIMIASYVGGLIATIMAGIIILGYRLLLFDNLTTYLVAIIQIILFIIAYYLIDKLTKSNWKRWLGKTVASLLVVVVSYDYILRDVSNKQMILLYYTAMVIIAGILEYYILEYIKTTNHLYRKYKMDSTKDFLTGLTNTRQFDKIWNMTCERVQQSQESLTCLMIDIDFFKKINDTYGHAVGDLVLRELAETLKKSIRTTDIIARVGGEEFCALLFNCNKEQSFEIGQAINRAVQEHPFPVGDNNTIHITVSIGISLYPEDTKDLDALKELSDNALYKAKRTGRNKVCDGNYCKP